MTAFEEVHIPVLPFAAYSKFGNGDYKAVRDRAARLKGRRILHINSTDKGGGVAEMLASQVGLERGLGIDSRWIVLRPSGDDFFLVTKKIHDLLQGGEDRLDEKEKQNYLDESGRMAVEVDRFLQHHLPDLLIIHDPQPLAMGCFFPNRTRKVLRLHIDLSDPDSETIEFLRPYVRQYRGLIVSRKDYRNPWAVNGSGMVIMPAIDPLAEKNREMSVRQAREILSYFNIHPDRPIVSQVSRFDPWKDPLGVIEAYDHAKNRIRNLQLLLVGLSQARDDLTAQEVFNRVKRRAGRDPAIHLFIDPDRLGDVSNDTFVNAVQTGSDIVIQKSLREGFGLTVTEAMWKGKTVIGGNVGGITLQLEDGKNGFLVESPDETAQRIVEILEDGDLSERLGREAKKTVLKKFLLPRYLRENFDSYLKALNGKNWKS
jgi:trehalose synthase